MVDFYGFHVGKYTSPMDPSWVLVGDLLLFIRILKIPYHPPQRQKGGTIAGSNWGGKENDKKMRT